MRIDRVTITGADDSVEPDAIVELSAAFPYVEWGLLLCKSYEGSRPCYPSLRWMERLALRAQKHGITLAGHLCGSWVQDLVKSGSRNFLVDRPSLWSVLRRAQLNYAPYRNRTNDDVLIPALVKPPARPYIFQVSLPEDKARVERARAAGIDALPLFDRSGGRGKTPVSWPAPYAGVYCGYAGGLGPDDLPEQLERIAAVAGDATIWIDMESKVRSEGGEKFDLDKVRRCLEAARPWLGEPGA